VKAVKQCVKHLPFEQWAEALRTVFNPDSVTRVKVEVGLFKVGDNPTVDEKVFKLPTIARTDANYPFDAVFGKKLKRPDNYQDVRQQVVEDLQDYLEQEWVASLRNRYRVEVNQEVLKTVNKHL
jgi:peptidyl-prolyl cis-trans isomerase SurA